MSEQQKENKSNQLPESAIQFIEHVIKKVRYRKKIRTDVRVELMTHFEDELQDCKTEQERLDKAAKLIEEFGDIKLLATLIRRAKKRCRSLWRTVIVRSFQTLGILILCFISYVVWFLSGKPVISKNYIDELNNLVRPKVVEAINAAPYYQKAIDTSPMLSDDFIIFFLQNYKDERNSTQIEELKKDIGEFLSNRDDTFFQDRRKDINNQILNIIWNLQEKRFEKMVVEHEEIIKKLILQQNESLNYLVEGSQKPYCWFSYKPGSNNIRNEMLTIVLPNLLECKKLARFLIWRAWIKAQQGQYEDAFEDIGSCFRFGKHLRGDVTLVEQLVGIAIQGLSVVTIRDIAIEYELNSEILEKVQSDYEKLIKDENFALSFKADRLIILDEIQRSFTSDKKGGGHLYLPRLSQYANDIRNYGSQNTSTIDNLTRNMLIITDMFNSNHFILTHPNKIETIKAVNEYYDIIQQLYEGNKEYSQEEKNTINAKIEHLVDDNYFLELFSPPLRRLHLLRKRALAEMRATLIIIALIRYKQDKGQYPQDLNELVSQGYLNEIPIDPFSDKPLVYKLNGNDFIFYSYGMNRIDDGGKPFFDNDGNYNMWSEEDSDAVFWPVIQLQKTQE